MKIAIVGNRKGWTQDQVFNHLNNQRVYREATLIISGGAEGVDSYAQAYAKSSGIPILIYYPFINLKSPDRFFERNKKIAEDCDKMIAFDKNIGRSGTSNTRHHAMSLGKKVIHIVK